MFPPKASHPKEAGQTGVVESSIRVRYAETDRMGVAYYANHFIWFEVGRSDYCRARGFSYADMERDSATLLMVVEARCRYRGAVTYDDELVVQTWLKSLGKRLMTFGYNLVRKDDGLCVAEGETVHIVTDRTGKPRSLPDVYYRLLKTQA